MPLAVSADAPIGSAAGDELDKLLDYDAAVDEFMRDLPGADHVNTNAAATSAQNDMDKEITVRKKRKPVPKLDEAMLLSAQGIPKLRRISKHRLKFRGKGHEFSDIGRLLNMYQLWMDDMYPRAKFRDAMSMIEKVGHSKRMQVTRKVWLDDTKPSRSDVYAAGEQITDDTSVVPRDFTRSESMGAGEILTEDRGTRPAVEAHAAHGATTENNDVPDDDELSMLLTETSQHGDAALGGIGSQRAAIPFIEDNSDGDELDALLDAEQKFKPTQIKASNSSNSFDEEPEDDPVISRRVPLSTGTGRKEHDEPHDFADEEAVLAEMGFPD